MSSIGGLTTGSCGACQQEEDVPPGCATFFVSFEQGLRTWMSLATNVAHPQPGRSGGGVLSATGGRTAAACLTSSGEGGERIISFEMDLGVSCTVQSVSYWRRTQNFVGGAGFPFGLHLFNAAGTNVYSVSTNSGLSTVYTQQIHTGPFANVRYITITNAVAPNGGVACFIDDIDVVLA